jgi:uncharacterized protein YbbC (DUF1343 family)
LPEIGFIISKIEATFEAKRFVMQKLFLFCGWMLLFGLAVAHPKTKNPVKTSVIVPATERLDLYLPLLKGRNVALFANQTSMVGQTHLVDILVKKGITIKKIFSPEHGFRGVADAGEHVESNIDSATGLPVISLYGSHTAPTAEELTDVDVMVFDIQDVGVRFYTYISSLQYYLEAALKNDKPLLILDRPNPNGFYVDGPVLQPGFKSFVGMQPIPVVYGMTIGEYAKMLLGERMLNDEAKAIAANLFKPRYIGPSKMVFKSSSSVTTPLPKNFWLEVIPCKNYDHTMTYTLPVRPSPNLPNQQSIILYPSLCYFEGTEISLGRGTDKPFQCFGHPSFPDTLYSFTPASLPGAKNPPLLGKTCYGYDLSQNVENKKAGQSRRIHLSYLLKAYKMFPQKDSFFLRPKKGNPSTADYFFNKLTGNDKLMWQILNGKTETEIRSSWMPDIIAFKKIRKKYLLYKDFE